MPLRRQRQRDGSPSSALPVTPPTISVESGSAENSAPNESLAVLTPLPLADILRDQLNEQLAARTDALMASMATNPPVTRPSNSRREYWRSLYQVDNRESPIQPIPPPSNIYERMPEPLGPILERAQLHALQNQLPRGYTIAMPTRDHGVLTFTVMDNRPYHVVPTQETINTISRSAGEYQRQRDPEWEHMRREYMNMRNARNNDTIDAFRYGGLQSSGRTTTLWDASRAPTRRVRPKPLP